MRHAAPEPDGTQEALARTRAVLDRARSVMDGDPGAHFCTVPAAASPAGSRRHNSAAMIALACAILVALGLALHYRMRISRTAAEVAQMSALVAAAQEQQKREGARHACQVEELKKELEDAREASKGRARFLGIF